MNIIYTIRERAKSLNKRVIFPESRDPRVLKAAAYLNTEKLCRPILVGSCVELQKIAGKEGVNLENGISFTEFDQSDRQDELSDYLYNRRRHKGLTREEAESLLRDNPLLFAAALVAKGYADGAVAGSIGTTGDVIKAAILGIGLADNTSIASSIFLIAMPDGRVFTYGDCGVVPYPDSKQLADIALQSSTTHRLLTGTEPVTAMLSFSTKGSAHHERVDLITKALELARKKEPGLTIDGELQFDAALIPDVASRKAPVSDVAGKANVFIFPNLDAGNIAYKITERLAGGTATGPILQGLAKPMMDLSRGCSWEDIVNAACVAVLMGEKA